MSLDVIALLPSLPVYYKGELFDIRRLFPDNSIENMFIYEDCMMKESGEVVLVIDVPAGMYVYLRMDYDIYI